MPMRNEAEMLRLILDTAQQDERIRAVVLNGSRANPQARRDPFQDYDIVYVVTDVAPFRRNLAWIARFGEPMILQLPDDMEDPPPDGDGATFTYLMQFVDGNRIDLTLFPLERADQLERDSLSVLLLDKDGVVTPFPPASEADYLPRPPTAKQFHDCCNEFWWVCPYVAKGLWRQQALYARQMMEQVLRPQLMKMLDWHVGVVTQFSANPGKFGRNLQRCLSPDLWALLLQTCADADEQRTWEALEAMCRLLRTAATRVGAHFGYEYPHGDDQRVSAHLAHVRHLPADAPSIY